MTKIKNGLLSQKQYIQVYSDTFPKTVSFHKLDECNKINQYEMRFEYVN